MHASSGANRRKGKERKRKGNIPVAMLNIIL
jgi:hypothetical protein